MYSVVEKAFSMTSTTAAPGSYARTRNDYYDLMRYYAYGECIECRAATLSLNRGYVDFINSVYRYVSLLFASPGTFTAAEFEEHRVNMWKFAWENQRHYMELLKTRARRNSARELDLKAVTSAVVNQHGYAAFATVQKGYKHCVDIDQTLCDYVDAIEAKGVPSAAPFRLNKGIWRDIAERVKYMNEILPLLKKADKILGRDKTKPGPAAVAAGLYVFTSHLGRAFVKQYVRPDGTGEEKDAERKHLEDESNEWLKGSIPFLERALLDAYKEILIAVIDKVHSFHESGCATETWWASLTEARKMEHDRKGFDKTIQAYKQLETGIHDFLEYHQLKHPATT